MAPNPGSAGWWRLRTCAAKPRCKTTGRKSLTVSSATSTRTMIEKFQKLTRRSEHDRSGSTFRLLEVLLWVIFAPFEGLLALAIVGFTRSFSGAMQTQNKGFDDPVYKKS